MKANNNLLPDIKLVHGLVYRRMDHVTGDSLHDQFVWKLSITEGLSQQNNKNERLYNLRSRVISYDVGQEVFRKNYRQVNFQAGYNTKLGPKYLKARVRRKVWNSYYDLEIQLQ